MNSNNNYLKRLSKNMLQRRGYTRPYFIWGCFTIVAFAIVVFYLAIALVQQRQQSMENEIFSRMELQSDGQASVLKTWLEGVKNLGSHVTQADMVRLFAAEVESKGAGAEGLRAQLVAQLPYMRQMVHEFVEQNSLVDAYMLNSKHHVYLSANSSPKLNTSQKEAATRVFETGDAEILPLREIGNNLVMDVIRPIFSLEQEEKSIIGALLIMLPVGEELAHLMEPGIFTLRGERTYLFQVEDGQAWQIDNALNRMEKPLVYQERKNFSAYKSPIDNAAVFGASVDIPHTPFVVSHEYKKSYAMAPLAAFEKATFGIVGLALALMIAIIVGASWYLMGQRNRQRVSAQEQAIDALVRAVEIRDPYLAGHYQRMARLSLKVGSAMNMPVHDRSTLYYASMLAGIGKIFVPQEVLTKPGKLNNEERDVLQQHIEHAMNVLGDIDFDFPIAPIIHQMHERMDGSGYPNKMSGDDILKLSRVLGVCDVYCALTSPRSYRAREIPENALKTMRSEASKYDPSILQALDKVVQEYEQE